MKPFFYETFVYLCVYDMFHLNHKLIISFLLFMFISPLKCAIKIMRMSHMKGVDRCEKETYTRFFHRIIYNFCIC